MMYSNSFETLKPYIFSVCSIKSVVALSRALFYSKVPLTCQGYFYCLLGMQKLFISPLANFYRCHCSTIQTFVSLKFFYSNEQNENAKTKDNKNVSMSAHCARCNFKCTGFATCRIAGSFCSRIINLTCFQMFGNKGLHQSTFCNYFSKLSSSIQKPLHIWLFRFLPIIQNEIDNFFQSPLGI